MPKLNPDPRPPAHFRALCTALGISAPDLARILGVNPRSARNWMFTTIAPQAAWDIVDTQTQWLQDTLDSILEGLEDAEAEEDDVIVEVALSTYATDASAARAGLTMPANWHQAAIGIIALLLDAEGYEVTITYVPQKSSHP